MVDNKILKKNFHGFDGDPTDDFANKAGYVIEFHHIPTGKNVVFKAMLTNFADTYDSDWSEEQVYGRMDPIKTFKSTKRTISLGWSVVAGSMDEAKDNMSNCGALFQMLYPTYAQAGSTSVLQSPPLFKLKVLNLVQDVSRDVKPGTYASAAAAGLVGSVSGFTYSPELDEGFFSEGQGTVYPQALTLECEFSCMHTHPMGFDDEGKPRNKKGIFPYNISTDPQEPETTGGTANVPAAPSGTSSQGAKPRQQQVQEERLTSEGPGDDLNSQPL